MDEENGFDFGSYLDGFLSGTGQVLQTAAQLELQKRYAPQQPATVAQTATGEAFAEGQPTRGTPSRWFWLGLAGVVGLGVFVALRRG